MTKTHPRMINKCSRIIINVTKNAPNKKLYLQRKVVRNLNFKTVSKAFFSLSRAVFDFRHRIFSQRYFIN